MTACSDFMAHAHLISLSHSIAVCCAALVTLAVTAVTKVYGASLRTEQVPLTVTLRNSI